MLSNKKTTFEENLIHTVYELRPYIKKKLCVYRINEDEEDILQELVLKLLRNKELCGWLASVTRTHREAYLKTMVKNLIIDYLRKENKVQQVDLDSIDAHYLSRPDYKDSIHKLEEQHNSREIKKLIDAILSDFSESEQLILFYNLVEGYKPAQIAEMANVDPKIASKRINLLQAKFRYKFKNILRNIRIKSLN